MMDDEYPMNDGCRWRVIARQATSAHRNEPTGNSLDGFVENLSGMKTAGPRKWPPYGIWTQLSEETLPMRRVKMESI